MAITPINVSRVSNNLRAFQLLRSVQSTQLGLFRSQTQIATGLRFQAPSEDPTAAAAVNRLDRRMDIITQVNDNLRTANAALREGETAMQEAVDKVIEAHTLAIETIGDTRSADERAALKVVVDSAIEALLKVGNRAYLDTFLFSGHFGDASPFEWLDEGVLFRGDAGRLQTVLDTDLSQDTFTISGQEFFAAVSEGVRGLVDLNPRVTSATRLSDLLGATGTGIDTGRMMLTTGAQQVTIDLAGADTIGDVLDRMNAALPSGFSAALNGNALAISGAAPFTLTDVAGGNTAVELGLFTNSPVASVVGGDLDPRLTLRTALSDLNGGLGLALNSGLTIRNGSRVATVDFSGAQTIEDVLNRINQSDTGVAAEIAPDGRTLLVRNRISGTDLSIEENGGQDATLLGIRSMHGDLPLADLNDGRGVDSVEGDDLRIRTADGTIIDVDIDALDLATATLQDFADLLNAAGGGRITVDFAATGNGLRITDNTSGAGSLTLEPLNLSPALSSLGLNNLTSTGGQLLGGDVNPVRVDSPFTALLELRAALEDDDSRGISFAAERLEGNLDHMLRIQGQLASTARTMLDRTERVADESTATEILRSDVRDVDLTEALVRFQQVQTALQANLSTSSRILSLSLLDYLQ